MIVFRSSEGREYKVRQINGQFECTCFEFKDNQYKRRMNRPIGEPLLCRHIRQIAEEQIWIEDEQYEPINLEQMIRETSEFAFKWLRQQRIEYETWRKQELLHCGQKSN